MSPEAVRSYLYMSQHDKTNKMTRAPSQVSDQAEHLSSLIRVFVARFIASQDSMLLHADSED